MLVDLHTHVISLGRSAARRAAALDRLQRENVSYAVSLERLSLCGRE